MTEYSSVSSTELCSLLMRTYLKRDAADNEIGEVLPAGWQELTVLNDYVPSPWLEELSMRIGVFKKGDQYVVAFEGLQLNDIDDLVATGGIYYGTGSVEYGFAIDAVQHLLDALGVEPNQLVFTGHSLGGAL